MGRERAFERDQKDISASVGPAGTSALFSESKRVCWASDESAALPGPCDGASALLPAAANELASDNGLPLRASALALHASDALGKVTLLGALQLGRARRDHRVCRRVEVAAPSALVQRESMDGPGRGKLLGEQSVGARAHRRRRNRLRLGLLRRHHLRLLGVSEPCARTR